MTPIASGLPMAARFAWVRDHGAAALPVATGPDQAKRLQMLFGSDDQVCRVQAL
jgi:hypothetical protein